MKTIKSLAIFVLALTVTSAVYAEKQSFNTSKSSVKWLGKKVTGEHSGTIELKEGFLEVEKGKINGGKVVMDMTSIADSEMNAKLVGHLKSDDFFGVTTFPTSELLITKVESSGNNHTFNGNLTIKGITHPITFTAVSGKDGKAQTYKGSLTIDRSKYNVRYGSSSFFNDLGNKVIYDEFTLDFLLVVSENSDATALVF